MTIEEEVLDAAKVITLRSYQNDCLKAIRIGWENFSRILAVLATGLGKTVIFSHVAKEEVDKGGKVLIIAHTDELLEQAIDKIFRSTGIVAEKEKADCRASPFASIVVASIQSLSRTNRLLGFAPDHFSLIITDETHRILAKSYQKVTRYFHFGAESLDENWVMPEPDVPHKFYARCLGVTATADRGDKRSLGEFYQTCVFDYGLLEGVRSGWLVRPIIRNIPLQKVDMRGIKKRGGDYDAAEVVARMEPFLRDIAEKLAGAMRDDVGRFNRKLVVFTPSVQTAEILSRFLREYSVDADFVSGACNDREAKVADFDHKPNGAAICCAMLLIEGWDCLDSETEILTDLGWLKREEVKSSKSLNVYTLNRGTGKGELIPVLEFGERIVREGEQMISVKSQHCDMRVTEGHELHIHEKSGYKTIKACDLVGSKKIYSLPLCAPMEFPGLELTDDEIRLIAWFMTDGGFQNYAFQISQSKDTKKEIRDLLRRIGLDFTERILIDRKGAYKNQKPLHIFMIPKGTHRGIKRSGWFKYNDYLNKNVSPLLHRMDRRQFTIFWDELLKGDGEESGNKTGWLWCDRKEQADAYTKMAILRGYSASYSTRLTKNNHLMFRVSVRDKSFIASNPSDKRSAKITASIPDEKEIVWCVKNANSTLITRRNGKIVVTGNCHSVNAICVLRHTKIRSLYAQAAGRGFRPIPGTVDGLETAEERLKAIAESDKPDCLMIDFLFHCDTMDLIEAVDIVATSPKEKEAIKATGIMDLEAAAVAGNRDLLASLKKAAAKHARREARTVDPLALAMSLGDSAIAHYVPETKSDAEPMTAGQLNFLVGQRVEVSAITCKGMASKIIGRIVSRLKFKLASPAQLSFMLQLGVDEQKASVLTAAEATATIDLVLKQKRAMPVTSTTQSPPPGSAQTAQSTPSEIAEEVC